MVSQHRRIEKDINIVLIDVTRWSRLPFLFPMSYFRDIKSALKRASCIVLTYTDSVPEQTEKLTSWIQQRLHLPIYTMSYRPQSLVDLSTGKERHLKEIGSAEVASICGIAQPHNFFNMISDLDVKIKWKQAFRDHHYYTRQDMEKILDAVNRHHVRIVITTQKDAVKLKEMIPESDITFYYLKIRCEVKPEEKFIDFLSDRLSKKKGST